MSEEEDEYDVRAVEARLARMEAARHMRAGTSRAQVQAPLQPPVRSAVGYGKGQMRQAVGDFELSEMDSSASDSEDCDSVSTSSASDDEMYRPQKQRGQKETKMGLKDSLDLSMSMSVAWPQEVERPPRQAVSGKDEAKESTKKMAVSTSNLQARSEPSDASRLLTEGREDMFAGKLIQRRRELERQATREPDRADQEPRHDTQPRQLSSRIESNVMKVPATESKMAGAVASRLVKPTDHRRDDQPIGHHQRHIEDRALVQPQPQARLPVKAPDSTETTKCVGLRPQGIPIVTKPPQVAMPLKPEDNSVRRESPVVDNARPVASRAMTQPLMPRPSVVNTHPLQITQREKDKTMKDPIPTNPPVIRQAKTSVAFTISQSTAKALQSEPVAAKALVETSTQGYARVGSSNQPQMAAPVSKAVVPSIIAAKNEPQEDPEDLIDDLLTAEELRLRESLDKLSSRLHSLATARETHTRTAKASNITQSEGKYAGRTLSQPNTNDDDMVLDDAKAVRVGSYGGGAHARLRQPTSPTTRVSNAKRSELSSGVHKARVRPGATLVQDAGNVPAAEGGKHKVVIKKDLAHLLF